MLVMAPFNLLLGLSCRPFVRLVSDAVERPLTRGERLRRAAHRTMCEVCRVHERRLGTSREVSPLLARSTDDDVSAACLIHTASSFLTLPLGVNLIFLLLRARGWSSE